MRKNFGGELGKQPGEIVVLFTISPGCQFEHALTAAPQLLGITRSCRFRRLIRHLIHLSKKLTLRRLVPDISIRRSRISSRVGTQHPDKLITAENTLHAQALRDDIDKPGPNGNPPFSVGQPIVASGT
jgi:hypothetical protein